MPSLRRPHEYSDPALTCRKAPAGGLARPRLFATPARHACRRSGRHMCGRCPASTCDEGSGGVGDEGTLSSGVAPSRTATPSPRTSHVWSPPAVTRTPPKSHQDPEVGVGRPRRVHRPHLPEDDVRTGSAHCRVTLVFVPTFVHGVHDTVVRPVVAVLVARRPDARAPRSASGSVPLCRPAVWAGLSLPNSGPAGKSAGPVYPPSAPDARRSPARPCPSLAAGA